MPRVAESFDRDDELSFLSTVLDTVDALVIALDRDRRIVRFNRACERASGYTADEMIGKEPWMLVPEEERRAFELIVDYLLAGNFPYSVETHWQAKDGSRRLIAWTNNAIVGEAGRVEYVIGTGIDRTGQRDAEQQARRNDRLLRDAIDNTDAGIVIFDAAGQAAVWNSAFETMFPGQPPSDNDGLHLDDHLKGSVGDADDVVGSGSPIEFGTANGRTIRCSGRRVLGGGTILVHTDISDLKQAQAALEKTNQELEQFAYLALHDLKEPLRSITGFCDLLREKLGDDLDAEANQYFDFVTDGADRLNTLVQDLLSYARIDAEERKVGRIDCEAVLAEVTAQLAREIRDSGAEIEAGLLPPAWADQAGIRLLLSNLIGNAIKYQKGGIPRIRVTAENGPEGWTLSVSDNGIGIDPRHAERIFEPFKRLHTRSAFPGSGIGLAICKKVVDRHHGRIWVEPAPQRGSTFFVFLPASPDESAAGQ